jgi:hypothetical protein
MPGLRDDAIDERELHGEEESHHARQLERRSSHPPQEQAGEASVNLSPRFG